MQLIEKVSIPIVVSSALESSVGISAGVALAAQLPKKNESPLPFGLGTVALLEGDVVINPLLPVDGKIKVEKANVDVGKLKKYSVSDSRKNGGTRESLIFIIWDHYESNLGFSRSYC